MKGIALLLTLAGATACGASQPAATTPSNNTSDEAPPGATNAQAADNPNRALTKAECQDLGNWMAEVCHSNHSRQSRIEGWCSDIVSRAQSGSWADECVKSVKYMDSVCFRSSDNPSAMMTCDRTAGQ
jgi:hypothetical protein